MANKLLLSYIIVQLIRLFFLALNLGHLRRYGKIVPPEFEGVIDPARLAKISSYTVDTSRVEIYESLAGILATIFFFFGILGWYDRWITSLSASLIVRGICFIFFIQLAETVIFLPFSLYTHFGVEKQYGFNTMTPKLWMADSVKTFLLSLVLSAVVVATMLGIWRIDQTYWWLWAWLFLLGFGIFMLYISPVLIEPLFYKFERLRIPGLEEDILSLMKKAGLNVNRVLQVDASRRSTHSNAYFTGIGRVKRIVLFDTLLTQLTREEIIGVLAHEAGHWKKRHVLKGIVLSEAMAFLALFIASKLIQWQSLPILVGLDAASLPARAAILLFLGSMVSFFFTPIRSALSRRNEREADAFASRLAGNPDALASGLVKLSRDNLSNLHPHPLYAWIYYSHPPVVERIRELRSWRADC